jgi:uncharacterized protein YjaG (DUF416 family)
MPGDEIKSIDDYDRFLSRTLEGWSSQQRVAWAAAMAERWLPIYEAFSAAEEWGDPASLHRNLEAVWQHVAGRTLVPVERARHVKLLEDSTPLMDDFDAVEAIAVCVILGEALECCATPDNAVAAVRAGLSGFEAAVRHWAFDPEKEPRLWKRIAAQREFKKQLKLVEQIGTIARFDNAAILGLRAGLTGPEYIGEVSPEPGAPEKPPTLTNQAAFEQYRRMVEFDLKSSAPLEPPGVADLGFAMRLFAAWGARYMRRRETIDGTYGRLSDLAAQQALVVRQRAYDARENRAPDWDPTLLEMINLCFQNSRNVCEAKSLAEPHGYGPSLRRLWAEAKQRDQSDEAAWRHILAWAGHRPAAWEAEDRRKEKGLAFATAALGERLARPLTWIATGDVDYPWAADVDGQSWRVALKNFPDELMYSLVIGAEAVGDFHDWPGTWRRQ